ncbi:MAG: hypothetical protein IJ744_04625 [Lachnospiraceae bacterium]|nr:hypothetical protein [Lachnospiraceae bacterium]
MLKIHLQIEKIDYETCMEELLPKLMESWSKKQTPSDLENFVLQLGANAVPAAKSVLSYMDVDQRDQIMVRMIGKHEEKLTEKANRSLEKRIPGAVKIGGLLAEDQEGAKVGLTARDVSVDYAKLLEAPAIKNAVEQMGLLKGPAKLALQMGANLSPDVMEKMGVTLLNSEAVKPKLLGVLSDALAQAGLAVTLSDLMVENV